MFNSQSSVERSINLDYLLFNSRYLRGNNGFFLRFLLIISQFRHISKNWYYDRIAEWREEEKINVTHFLCRVDPVMTNYKPKDKQIAKNQLFCFLRQSKCRRVKNNFLWCQWKRLVVNRNPRRHIPTRMRQ